jgi:hypothetical protein
VTIAEANKIRRAAAEYRQRVSSGELSIDVAIRECREAMSLEDLLRAAHGIEHWKAQRICTAARVRTDVRLRASTRYPRVITDDERERVVAALRRIAPYIAGVKS